MENKRLLIHGAGGFGREVMSYILDGAFVSGTYLSKDTKMELLFVVDDEYYAPGEILGFLRQPYSKIIVTQAKVIVAVADVNGRKVIVERYAKELQASFATILHRSVIYGSRTVVGEGSILAPNVVITDNIRIGQHVHINIGCSIGHDTIIGNFVTIAPGVNISGNCSINDCVYVGTNAALREGITICANTTIGMGSIVVKDIREPGIYVGNPARKIR